MDISKQQAAEIKVRGKVIYKTHFSHHYMVNKNTFVFRNVVSYWGKIQLYNRGYQIRLAWAVVDLPRWLQDYILFHEMAHMENIGRGHTRLFWQKLREVFPPTDKAEQALKELGKHDPAEQKEWRLRWFESPVRYSLSTSRKKAEPREPSLSAKYGADPTAAYQKFQEELAEKYGW